MFRNQTTRAIRVAIKLLAIVGISNICIVHASCFHDRSLVALLNDVHQKGSLVQVPVQDGMSIRLKEGTVQGFDKDGKVLVKVAKHGTMAYESKKLLQKPESLIRANRHPHGLTEADIAKIPIGSRIGVWYNLNYGGVHKFESGFARLIFKSGSASATKYTVEYDLFPGQAHEESWIRMSPLASADLKEPYCIHKRVDIPVLAPENEKSKGEVRYYFRGQEITKFNPVNVIQKGAKQVPEHQAFGYFHKFSEDLSECFVLYDDVDENQECFEECFVERVWPTSYIFPCTFEQGSKDYKKNCDKFKKRLLKLDQDMDNMH